jgi:hypothetical protein
MEPVGPPAARIGQRVPVPGQGQCPGLEPPIRGAGAAWASTALPPTTWRMTWSRARRAAPLASPYPDSRPNIECRNSPSGRWPRSCRNASFEVQPMSDRTAQGVSSLAHHRQTTVRTDLRPPKFQPHPAVKANPPPPDPNPHPRVIRQTRPEFINTMIRTENTTVRAAKSADHLGNAGSQDRVLPW